MKGRTPAPPWHARRRSEPSEGPRGPTLEGPRGPGFRGGNNPHGRAAGGPGLAAPRDARA
eukprot:3429617-Alexandrium_andersonii.AAC.1